jgi:hypothetical protein
MLTAEDRVFTICNPPVSKKSRIKFEVAFGSVVIAEKDVLLKNKQIPAISVFNIKPSNNVAKFQKFSIVSSIATKFKSESHVKLVVAENEYKAKGKCILPTFCLIPKGYDFYYVGHRSKKHSKGTYFVLNGKVNLSHYNYYETKELCPVVVLKLKEEILKTDEEVKVGDLVLPKYPEEDKLGKEITYTNNIHLEAHGLPCPCTFKIIRWDDHTQGNEVFLWVDNYDKIDFSGYGDCGIRTNGYTWIAVPVLDGKPIKESKEEEHFKTIKPLWAFGSMGPYKPTFYSGS